MKTCRMTELQVSQQALSVSFKFSIPIQNSGFCVDPLLLFWQWRCRKKASRTVPLSGNRVIEVKCNCNCPCHSWGTQTTAANLWAGHTVISCLYYKLLVSVCNTLTEGCSLDDQQHKPKTESAVFSLYLFQVISSSQFLHLTLKYFFCVSENIISPLSVCCACNTCDKTTDQLLISMY